MDDNNNPNVARERSKRPVRTKRCVGSSCCEMHLDSLSPRKEDPVNLSKGSDQNEKPAKIIRKEKTEEVELKPDFMIGDLVWAKVPGHCWWPAMVCYDPYKGLYFAIGSTRNKHGAIRYHVQFFGNTVHRGWVFSKAIMKFEGKEKLTDLQPTVARNGKKSPIKKKDLEVALDMAEAATKLTRKERRLTLTFNFANHSASGRRKSANGMKEGQRKVEKDMLGLSVLGAKVDPTNIAKKQQDKSLSNEVVFPPLNCTKKIFPETHSRGTTRIKSEPLCASSAVLGSGEITEELSKLEDSFNCPKGSSFKQESHKLSTNHAENESQDSARNMSSTLHADHAVDGSAICLDIDKRSLDVSNSVIGIQSVKFGAGEGSSICKESKVKLKEKGLKRKNDSSPGKLPSKKRKKVGELKKNMKDELKPAKKSSTSASQKDGRTTNKRTLLKTKKENEQSKSKNKIKDKKKTKSKDVAKEQDSKTKRSKHIQESDRKARLFKKVQEKSCLKKRERKSKAAERFTKLKSVTIEGEAKTVKRVRNRGQSRPLLVSEVAGQKIKSQVMKSVSPASQDIALMAKQVGEGSKRSRNRVRDKDKKRNCQTLCDEGNGISKENENTIGMDSKEDCAERSEKSLGQSRDKKAQEKTEGRTSGENDSKVIGDRGNLSSSEAESGGLDESTSKSRKQFLCSLCEEPGDLIFCRGTCCNAYHPDCLGLEMSEDLIQTFKCDECQSGNHICFACKHGGNVQRCSCSGCGKYYHKECTLNFKQDGNKVMCPLHYCDYCRNDRLNNNSGKRLIKCIRCPTAYHAASCFVAGCKQRSYNYMICDKHFVPLKDKAHHKHINVAWCFVCSKGGTLVCCETCPAAFHVECIEDIGDVLEEKWKCESCKDGKKPLYGDIVWVKFGSYRWWPAKICQLHEIPQVIQNIEHQAGEFPVQFYGTNDYQWLNIGRVFSFEEGDCSGKARNRKRMDSIFNEGLAKATQAFRLQQEEKVLKALRRESKKPPSYGHIRVNKYVTAVRNVVDLADIPVCECKYTDANPCGADSECLNRILQIECHPKKCLAKERCQNQRFQKNEYIENMPVRTKERGWGLFSKQDVRFGNFVIEYQGEMIDDATCRKRIVEYHEEGIDDYYFLVIDKDLIIDAYPKGNASRFMNHSCDPNCETQKWTVNGDIRVGLFANRAISKGEELTFNYNLDCLGNDKKQCKCGSSNCSGFIGERPRNTKGKTEKGEKDQKKKKKKTKKSRRGLKISEPAIHDDVCFTCKDGGDLILCDNPMCMKCYHLDCLTLNKTPRGKWECPWHFCDTCGQRSKVFCFMCPNSSCQKHSEENMQLVKETGLYICDEHDEVELACAFDKDCMARNSISPRVREAGGNKPKVKEPVSCEESEETNMEGGSGLKTLQTRIKASSTDRVETKNQTNTQDRKTSTEKAASGTAEKETR